MRIVACGTDSPIRRLKQAAACFLPASRSSQMVLDELTFYLWVLPAMNMYGMKEGSEKAFGKGYFVIVRLYAPTQPYFGKTWKLPDIEKIK
jgi:hypothetical protein